MPEEKFVKTHQPCPCGGSSDAYAVRADGSGKCFSGKCGGANFFPKDYKPSNCVAEPFAERGVPAEIGRLYDFHALKDDQGNTLFYRYDFPNGVQKFRRVIDKHHWWSKPKDAPTPALGGIGMFDMPANKTCVVVEGEPDAVSAYYMLNAGMATETPVYWLTSATISATARPAIFDELSKYDRVIMAIEDDQAGNSAKEILASILPQQIRIASLNKHKDANEYLLADNVKEFKRAVKNYSRYTPEYIASGLGAFESIWEDEQQDFYVPINIPGLEEKIPGIPLGGVTLITGSEGIGKTEILRFLEWQVLSYGLENPNVDIPVSVSHFEETDKDTLRGLACYDQHRNFRDRQTPLSWQEARPTMEKLSDRLFITNLYKARDELSIKSFMEKVSYLHFVCGVKYFFFDPINQLRPDSPDETLVKFLDGLAMETARFASDHQVGFVWTAHINDDGATRDSRMIAKAASIRIEAERDLDTFDETERNKTYLKVKKNRTFGPTGDDGGHMLFDSTTSTLYGGQPPSLHGPDHSLTSSIPLPSSTSEPTSPLSRKVKGF